jgi:hypothetical protein
VLEVLDEGVPVTVIARRYGVMRRRCASGCAGYANEGGLVARRTGRRSLIRAHRMAAAVEVPLRTRGDVRT